MEFVDYMLGRFSFGTDGELGYGSASLVCATFAESMENNRTTFFFAL